MNNKNVDLKKELFKLKTVTAFIVLLIILNGNSLGYVFLLGILIVSLFSLRNSETLFCIFVMTTLAMGANINLKYNFGSWVFCDIILAELVIARLFEKKKVRKEYILLVIGLLGLSIYGISRGNAFYNVFQDVKLSIYLFVPLFFLKDKNYHRDRLFFEKFTYTLTYCLITISIQEIFTLFNTNIRELINNGFSTRNVSINVQAVNIIAVWVLALKKQYNISSRYIIILEILGAIAVVCSFTRTVWIEYIITMAYVFIFWENHNTHAIIKKISIVIISIGIIILLINSGNEYINNMIETVKIRFNGIFEMSTNNINTLEVRNNSAINLIREKIIKPTILIGCGFGDLGIVYGATYSVFCENSLIYYIWKYGMLIVTYWILIFLKNVKYALKSSNQTKTLFISMLIYVLIGNMSGNLNFYYITILTAITWDFRYMFSNNKMENE